MSTEAFFCVRCGQRVGDANFCTNCGMALDGPSARRLRDITTRIRLLEAQRQGIESEIAGLILEQAETSREIVDEAASPSVAVAHRTALTVRSSSTVPSSEGGEFAPEGGIRSAERTKLGAEISALGVRNVLIWTGSILLALSAVAFVGLEWRHLGSPARAAILAVVTLIVGSTAVWLRERLPVTSSALGVLCALFVGLDWVLLRRSDQSILLSNTSAATIAVALVAVTGFALGRLGVRHLYVLGVVGTIVFTPLALASGTSFALPYEGNPIWHSFAWSTIALAYVIVAAVCAGRAKLVPSVALLGGSAVIAMICAEVTAAEAGAINLTNELTELVALSVFVSALVPATARVLMGRIDPNQKRLLPHYQPLDLLDDVLVVIALAAVAASLIIALSVAVSGWWLMCAAMGITLIVVAAVRSGPTWMGVGASWLAALGVSVGLIALVPTAVGSLTNHSYSTVEVWSGSLNLVARDQMGVVIPQWAQLATLLAWLAVVVFGSSLAGPLATPRQHHQLALIPRALAGIVAIASIAPITSMLLLLSGASIRWMVLGDVLVGALLSAWLVYDLVRRSDPGVWWEISVAATTLTIFASAFGWSLQTQGSTLAVVVLFAASSGAVAWAARDRDLGVFASVVTVASLEASAALVAVIAGSDRNVACLVATLSAATMLALIPGSLRARTRLTIEVATVIGVFVPSAFLDSPNRGIWFAINLTIASAALAIDSRHDDRFWLRPTAAMVAIGSMWSWLGTAEIHTLELYTWSAGAVLLGIGWSLDRAGRVPQEAHVSWLIYGPGLLMVLFPSVVLVIKQENGARAAALAIVALVTLLIGTSERLQSPVVLGAVTLLALAIRLVGPLVVDMPRWVTLAIAGVVLLWFGARAEKHVAKIRHWSHQLQELR